MEPRMLHDTKRAEEGHAEYITILDKFDFGWTEEEMKRGTYLYNNDYSLAEMAKELRSRLDADQAQIEIVLLTIHLGFEKKLGKRKKAFLV